jgi:Transcription factor zinc-finger
MVLLDHLFLFDPEATMHGFGSGELGLPALLVGGVLVIGLAALILHLLFPAVRRRPRRGMVLTKMARLCPVCQRKLNEADRNGLRIAVCPDCHGVWLGHDQLEHF